jgi:hypothetical protein
MHLLLFGEPVGDVCSAAAEFVVTEVVVERPLDDCAAVVQIDRGLRGRDAHPSRRGGASTRSS